MIILLPIGLIITISVIENFPELYTHSKKKIVIELVLINYATKPDLKSAAGVDTSNFAKKVDLASLKPDISKLGPTPVDLCKLSDIEKYKAVQNNECKKLVKKVNGIQTTDISNLVRIKLTITQKFVKMKRKYLIMIMVDILLHKNLEELI